jgi:hypothetical protein
MWQDDFSSSDDNESDYSSSDDDTPPGVTSVYINTDIPPPSSVHEDVWNTEVRTSVHPTRLRISPAKSQELRDPLFTDESPRTGLSPHGFTLKTWLHNFKKAVASENIQHTCYCLASYFTWFSSVEVMGDNGVQRILPLQDEELLSQFQEKECSGGVFNNRWSLFLHQQLYLILHEVFFEIIGVVGSTLLSRIHDLWVQYELSLFCMPTRSLSKLLTIGKMMVDSHKNGAVFFTSFVFADSALMRRRRDQISTNPDVLRYFHKAKVAEEIVKTLTTHKPVYFKQRHRKNLYRDCFFQHEDEDFLNVGNLLYLLQAVPLSDKKTSKVFSRNKECALRLSERNDLKSLYLASVIEAEVLYSRIYRRCNMIACRHTFHQVLIYDLVYTHLLSKLVSENVDVWSTSYFHMDEVSHEFSRQLLDSVKSSCVPMIYGVLAEKAPMSCKKTQTEHRSTTTTSTSTSTKRRKVSISEQQDLRTSCGPSLVALSHQQAYAASKCFDGHFYPADFVLHCNYAKDVLAYLEEAYYTIVNFPSLSRQYNRTKTVTNSVRHPPQPFTDSVMFDFGSLVPTSTVTPGMHIVFRQKATHQRVPFEEFDLLSPLWSGDKDTADILFDFLCGNRDVDEGWVCDRERCWFQGPHPIECEEQLLQQYTKLNAIRRLCGLEVGEHSLIRLVVQDCPLTAQDTNIVTGNPYLFYVETIHTDVTLSQSEAKGLKHVCVTKPVLTLISNLEKSGLLKGTVASFSMEQVVITGLLLEAFGDETLWDTCFATHQVSYLESSVPQIRATPCKVVPSLHLRASINTTRNSAVWEPVWSLYRSDENQEYNGSSLHRLISVTVEYLCDSMAHIDRKMANELAIFFNFKKTY